MNRRSEETLSRRERQIMDIVYRRGAATAAEVLNDLPDPPSKTAVRTLLKILEEKGHLQHVEEGQTYVYRPCQSRQKAGRSALSRVLTTFFDGSLEKALAAHFNDDTVDLTADELNRLLELIRESKKKGR